MIKKKMDNLFTNFKKEADEKSSKMMNSVAVN